MPRAQNKNKKDKTFSCNKNYIDFKQLIKETLNEQTAFITVLAVMLQESKWQFSILESSAEFLVLDTSVQFLF